MSKLKIDSEYDSEIKPEEINDATKRTSSDNAPGPDYIIPRTLKLHSNDISPILSKLAILFMKWNYVPNCFRKARTVLAYKDDRNDVKNWRPITVCSLLSRIIEKVLDKHLRFSLIFAKLMIRLAIHKKESQCTPNHYQQN